MRAGDTDVAENGEGGGLSSGDFEEAGLLEGLEDDEREARLDLLQELADAGCSLDELKEAVDEDRLPLLPVELVLEGESKYTLSELAERVGMDAEFFAREIQAIGLSRPEPDERRFGEDDEKAAEATKQFLDAGLPQEGMLEVSRVAGQGLARVAEAIRALVGETFLEPGMTERDLGLRYAEAARRLGPLIGPLLERTLNLHLREGIKSDVVGRANLETGEMAGAREMAVGFADLVGFTRLGGEVPADQLGEVAGRLERIATEVVEPPVKLVKMIGDAAMFVSPEAPALLGAALDLVERADQEGEEFPQLKVGVACGQVVGRGGDWYGHPVNVADRITGIARPGSVVATDEVREAVEAIDGAGFNWSRTRPKKVRGVAKPIPLFRVRRDSGDEEDDSDEDD